MKLVLEDIGHAFLGRTVFERLDLSIAAGEVVALVGPSGCGKTTVLQIAAGLIEPLRGRVRRSYERHAVVFQEPRLLPWMNARDNIGYGLRAVGTRRGERERIAERRAADVGLLARDLDKFPSQLSGGMRQRTAVARALAIEPDLVFFDEPFTAVDAVLRRSLQDLVIEAATRERFAALFVTHDLAEAARVAHRMLVMSGIPGRLDAERTVEGTPGARSDRAIFEIIEAWSADPALRTLFDAATETAT